MTVSPAERRVAKPLALAAAVMTAAALATTAAAAQTRGPMPLTPSAVNQPTAPRADPESVTPVAAHVEVQPLQAIDANSVGVLGAANGGLGMDMWAGTSLGMAQRLMPHLPAATPSRAARQLTRRLLLSEAAAPKGEPWGDATLLQLRAERLAAMGEVDAVLALLDVVPRAAITGPLVRARIDALLLARKDKAACEEMARSRDDGGDTALAKTRIFCQILAGRAADAQLGVGMLRETGHADPVFLALAEEMLGLPPTGTPSLPAPTPLLLAMLQATGKPMPPDAATSGHPAVLRAVAERGGAKGNPRLVAAEKAERVGVLDDKALAELYAAVEFDAKERARPSAEIAADATPRGRALLYQSVDSEATPATRIETVAQALAAARAQGMYFSAARLYAPLIAAIEPTAQPASFAEAAVRSLLAAGDATAAARWLPFAERQGGTAILARLAGLPGSEAPTPAVLAGWRSGLRSLPPAQAERQAAVVLGLLSALGDTIAAEDWVRLMGGPPLTSATMPQPALWHALPDAAAAGRRAETALLALVSLGEGGPAAAEPTSLHRIVSALRQVELVDDARALAVEAAIAHGL